MTVPWRFSLESTSTSKEQMVSGYTSHVYYLPVIWFVPRLFVTYLLLWLPQVESLIFWCRRILSRITRFWSSLLSKMRIERITSLVTSHSIYLTSMSWHQLWSKVDSNSIVAEFESTFDHQDFLQTAEHCSAAVHMSISKFFLQKKLKHSNYVHIQSKE